MPAAMHSAPKPAPWTTQPSMPSALTPAGSPAKQVAVTIPAQTEIILQPVPPLRTETTAGHQRPASPIPRTSAPQSVLMITAIPGAESCASGLAATLGVPVEIAASRKLGLGALRRRDYATVIVDDSIAEADPAGTELIWKHSGLAVPLQINFALVGGTRLGREVRAALARREQEQSLAMRAATSSLENDLKSTLAGLLLNSELALAEPSVPPQLASKLQLMVELAGTLRRRLEQPRL
jgi:hypothetical protein